MFSGEHRGSKKLIKSVIGSVGSLAKKAKVGRMINQNWGQDVRSFELEIGEDGRLKAKESDEKSSLVGTRF